MRGGDRGIGLISLRDEGNAESGMRGGGSDQ